MKNVMTNNSISFQDKYVSNLICIMLGRIRVSLWLSQFSQFAHAPCSQQGLLLQKRIWQSYCLEALGSSLLWSLGYVGLRFRSVPCFKSCYVRTFSATGSLPYRFGTARWASPGRRLFGLDDCCSGVGWSWPSGEAVAPLRPNWSWATDSKNSHR